MKFCTIDEDGRPTAFYTAEVHGTDIPAAAIEISDEDWQEYLAMPMDHRFVDGVIETCATRPPDMPEPSEE